MTDVLINYNPYKVQTTIEINASPIDSRSPLFFVQNHRLQQWIEPRGHWKGIFAELRNCACDNLVRIRFHGTAFDFADLVYANKKYGNVFDKVQLIHVNKDTCQQHDQASKLASLKELYEELQAGSVEEFKSEEIRKAFSNAINSDFEIVVVAPMSSGKSTLINAILGTDLLPAVNEATTAVITRIRDNDTAEQFTVSAYDKQGKLVCYRTNEDGSACTDENGNYIFDANTTPVEGLLATPELISKLNYAKDPDDPSGKSALVHETRIEGQIPAIPATKLNTVFVDTPGGNNAQNLEHQKLMEAAIRDENKSLILYVFNGTQTGTNDSDAILELIAAEMKKSNNGKQSRDRFLFVANRMDDFDPEKESYESYVRNSILPHLAKHGITEPNLLLVSAQLAKLLRVRSSGQNLTKSERSFLNKNISLFGDADEAYRLYRYSNISDLQKEAFDSKIDALIQQEYSAADNGIPAIAEINSGVPAVEEAIREYLDKYAVSIKIKVAHDTFMRKVREREMIDTCEAKWASSEEELKQVRAEVADKKRKLTENNKLAEYLDRIDSISLNQLPILNYEATLRQKITDLHQAMLQTHGEAIEKYRAKSILEDFKTQIETTMSQASKELVTIFNTETVEPCTQILSDYSAFIRTLEDGGLFTLGGLSVKKMDKFKDFECENLDDMLGDDEFIFTKTKTVRKSGILSGIARFFGLGGYEQVSTSYVKLSDLTSVKINELLIDFSRELKTQISDTETQIQKVKSLAHKKLQGINDMVNETIKAIEQRTSDETALCERVKDNQKTLAWLKDYIDRVDHILDI